MAEEKNLRNTKHPQAKNKAKLQELSAAKKELTKEEAEAVKAGIIAITPPKSAYPGNFG